jgi:signal transduction histidine kinase
MLQSSATPFFITAPFVIVASALMLFFIIFFYLFMIQSYRRRTMHLKDMHNLQAKFERTLLKSQLEIQEQTFRNISQEIHDNIGQALSLAKLNLNTINTHNIEDKLALTEDLLSKAIADLRDLSKSLNGEKITDLGLQAAIAHELALIEKALTVKTELVGDDLELSLDDRQVIVIFRMIQEVLNNILKHAHATSIKISLEAREEFTLITIKDDGVGFDPYALDEEKTGIGLKNMKQRARDINGKVTINTAPGQGTEVVITIQPLLNTFTV